MLELSKNLNNSCNKILISNLSFVITHTFENVYQGSLNLLELSHPHYLSRSAFRYCFSLIVTLDVV